MKTKNLLLLCIMAVGFFASPGIKAQLVADTATMIKQDSINARSLIISEVQMGRATNWWTYIELANTGDQTLDLGQYIIYDNWGNWYWDRDPTGYAQWKIEPHGTLEANDVTLILIRNWNWNTDPYDNLVYPSGYTNIEVDMIADTIFSRQGGAQVGIEDPNVIYKAGPENRIGVLYKNQITEYADSIYPDSLFIDRFGVARNDYPTGNIDVQDAYRFPIAGVESARPTSAMVYVRKYDVKKGNTIEGEVANDFPTIEWDNSRGTDINDSEWIPLPRSQNSEFDKIFTTIGYHGTSPELTISSEKATIDKAGEMITLPYGTSRDSVFRMFDFGVNHAWELKLGADTGKFFIQDDDSIFIYTAGEQLDIYKFGVSLSSDLPNFAQVAPKVYKNEELIFTRRYDISNGMEPMDTIGTLPFDLPVDTFFAYMEKDPNASWKIIPADGIARPEIKEGDYLEVTSPNGSVIKNYYLGVNRYFESDNANLATIILQGQLIFENPVTYDMTDTLIGFAPGSYFYSVNLPADITVSPAIVAPAADTRSRVVISRAMDLKGAEADRTATITVSAEDDSTVNVYKILFNVDRPTPPVRGSLFITDYGIGWGATQNDVNIQLYNPSSDDPVIMSDYVFVSYWVNNWQRMLDSFQNDSNWVSNNSHVLRFGSIIEPDVTNTPVFKTDLVQTKDVLEPQEVFSMCSRGGFPVHNAHKGATPEENYKRVDQTVDLIVGNENFAAGQSRWNLDGWKGYAQYKWGTTDPWGSGYLPLGNLRVPSLKNYSKSWATCWFGIAKILNDSVKDGTKHVMGDFDEDYEWIDVFGGVSRTTDMAPILYDNDTLLNFGNYTGQNSGLYRKPNVYNGNPIDGQSFGIADSETNKTLYPSEWVRYGVDDAGNTVNSNDEGTGLRDVRDQRLKNHVMITYAHIPYLSSSKYILEEGLIGEQQIYGVMSGTSVQAFLDNTDRADTGMVVKFFSSSNNVLGLDDVIEAGTTIWSKSASGLDSVNYVITTLGELDNACTLTSTTYTVSTTLPSGTISGISVGTTLSDLLDNVNIPATAIMMATDGKMQNLPLFKYNNDTIAIEELDETAVLASENTFIEVVAQDKVTKCVYSLVFEDEESPFILSDVYVIDEDAKIINFVNRTTPKGLISNLIASTGASIKIVNKFDQDRTTGMMEYSDRVVVSKGDMQVEYWINYSINDDVIGVNVKDVNEIALSIYPNPSTDFITVSGVSNAKFYEVRDLAGKLLTKKQITSDKQMISLKHLDAGIYLISINEANQLVTFKVVKE